MNTIRLAGQVITCVDYTTTRLFNLNPEPLKQAAENFLAAGITEIEIPQGVLDPDNRFPEKGIDVETLQRTIKLLPPETKVIASYLGGRELGKDNKAFLEKAKRTIDYLIEYFPHLNYVMLHPPFPGYDKPEQVKEVIATYAELANYAAQKRPGFQACLHNHYDSSCETAEQVRRFLAELERVNEPALRWGPDTGHCHGMKEQYLPILEEYAHLIGNYFHIKARIPAFDQLHGGEQYRKDRDIWGNKAEFGRGLYGGFVNAADPEIETPFTKIFEIIKKKLFVLRFFTQNEFR
mgnify:CR=1 FL=1